MSVKSPSDIADRPCASNRVDFDVVLVGGGLANQLIAIRLASLRPDLRVAIVERHSVIGGNHTWSCHATDLDPSNSQWMDTLFTVKWDQQKVSFPHYSRQLRTGYRTILSDDLRLRVEILPTVTICADASAEAIHPDHVRLADGRKLVAPLVIDGRGALRHQPLAVAYQKFFGLEVETVAPHGEAEPMIMDATVSQLDGYRFVYTLPMDETRILIEDTYYSDGPLLSDAALEERVRAYANAKGWKFRRIIRSERGILPITLAGDIDKHWAALGDDIPRVGLRAWLFHPTTGYSLPHAVRMADQIARAEDLSSRTIARLTQAAARKAWDEQSFMRLLNRMLFIGARPHERVRVMSRFYRLGEGLIERFYAGRSSLADKARVFSGRPPIPISRGLNAIPPSCGWDFVARQPETAAAEFG